jgi:putative ABC transport system permease protein
MSLFDGLRHRLRVLLRRDDYERELDEEFRFHLALEAAQREHAARGRLSAHDAQYAALRRFGNLSYHKEEVRHMTGLGFADIARQDARFALRTFRRTVPFTAVAVLTLAIGIGANTAIFSAVDAMLLRPLPYREPERLMKVSLIVPPRGSNPVRDDMVWSYPKFATFRDAQTVFSNVSLWTDIQGTVYTGGEAERVYYEYTDSQYFPTLGITPAFGRNFSAEEDRAPGGPRVAVLSHALWTRRFSSDSAVLGKTLAVGAESFTIVGVAPEGFRGMSGRSEFWVPILSQSAQDVNEAWSHSFYQVARLKPGVTIAQAKAEVTRLGPVVDRAWPHPEIKTEQWGAIARELDSTRVDPVIKRSLLILLGAVGLVLLIACANVANLFLVRAAGRRREIAVRLALGASRARLVRQLLTESVLLSIAGGLASIVIAWWGVKLLSAFQPDAVVRAQQFTGIGAVNFGSIRLDGTALAFAAALTMATALIFGLVPALQATRPSLTHSLKEGGDVPLRGRLRPFSTRNLLVVSEIALALVLLVGAGLMIRSLGNLFVVRSGINPDGVLTVRMTPPLGFGRDSLPGYYDIMLERLRALPGVSGVALSDCPPVGGTCNGTVVWRHDKPAVASGSEPEVGVHWMSPDWPAVMEVPLKRGRLFTNADRIGAPKAVLVNETAARTIWPGEDPVGRPLSVGQGGFWPDTAYVVGVVGDVRYDGLTAPQTADVYLPYAQSPRARLMLFVRTAGDPMAIIPAVRRTITELAPGVPLFEIRTMETRIADAMAYARFSTMLLGLFAAVALALATMGAYGVISFAVSQRTREIGIRVAIGATRTDVVRLIVGQGVSLVAAGAVVGVIAALATTKVLVAMLYDVAPSDPVTFMAIVAILVAAVVVASWIPARRAASVQPTEALRES